MGMINHKLRVYTSRENLPKEQQLAHKIANMVLTLAEHTIKEVRLHLQQLRMKDMWLIGG